MRLSISNDIASTLIYDNCDDFDFEIVNFPFQMVIFRLLHLMELTFHNLSDLLEHLAMLQISTLAKDFKLRNVLNKNSK